MCVEIEPLSPDLVRGCQMHHPPPPHTHTHTHITRPLALDSPFVCPLLYVGGVERALHRCDTYRSRVFNGVVRKWYGVRGGGIRVNHRDARGFTITSPQLHFTRTKSREEEWRDENEVKLFSRAAKRAVPLRNGDIGLHSSL